MIFSRTTGAHTNKYSIFKIVLGNFEQCKHVHLLFYTVNYHESATVGPRFDLHNNSHNYALINPYSVHLNKIF